MMKRAVIAFVAILAAALAGLTIASASQLSVSTRSVASLSDAICSNATISVTGSVHVSGNTWSHVQFSNIPSECNGRSLEYVLYQSNGAILRSGTTTAATGTVTVAASSNYDASLVEGARVLLGTWPASTAWVAPTPPSAPPLQCFAVNNGGNQTGQTCTVTNLVVSHWVSYPGAWGVGTPYYHIQATFDVSSPQRSWDVIFNFADSSWPGGGMTPTYVGSGYNIVKSPGYSCSSLPMFEGRKAAGSVNGQNNAVIFWTNAPGSTNGTTQLCP